MFIEELSNFIEEYLFDSFIIIIFILFFNELF